MASPGGLTITWSGPVPPSPQRVTSVWGAGCPLARGPPVSVAVRLTSSPRAFGVPADRTSKHRIRNAVPTLAAGSSSIRQVRSGFRCCHRFPLVFAVVPMRRCRWGEETFAPTKRQVKQYLSIPRVIPGIRWKSPESDELSPGSSTGSGHFSATDHALRGPRVRAAGGPS